MKKLILTLALLLGLATPALAEVVCVNSNPCYWTSATFTGFTTFTGQVRFADGTEALPGAAWAADLDTGFWRSAANTLKVSTGGTTRTTWSSAGLDVVGALTTTTTIAAGTSMSATKIALTRGAITTSDPGINLTQTWNDGAVAFTAAEISVTDTASSASSVLQNWATGGASKASLDKAGNFQTASSVGSLGYVFMGANSFFYFIGRALARSPADGVFSFTTNNEAAGVRLDFATDGIFKVRNRANSADAAITAGDVTVTGAVKSTGTVFASLPGTDGDIVYCPDCAVNSAVDNTCVASGTGALAVRIAGVSRCFVAQN